MTSKDCPAINAKVCGNPLCSEHFPGPDVTQTDSFVAHDLRCARMLLNESHADYRKLNERSIELERAIRLLELQRYGLTNAWASADWRKCEKHGTYARGGNWGAIEGKDGAVCPWCHAAELTKVSSDVTKLT